MLKDQMEMNFAMDNAFDKGALILNLNNNTNKNNTVNNYDPLEALTQEYNILKEKEIKRIKSGNLQKHDSGNIEDMDKYAFEKQILDWLKNKSRDQPIGNYDTNANSFTFSDLPSFWKAPHDHEQSTLGGLVDPNKYKSKFDAYREFFRKAPEEDLNNHPNSETLKFMQKVFKEMDRQKPMVARGGLIKMRDQMEMNFALGGVAETVDPVSGNDVPPGSLPVEVRDDIPARLSEGEYVVPADVVRYFGVRVFEEMRMEAKMGLQQMDADGRIGGEPMEPQAQQAELSDDDLNSIIEQAMQEQQPIMANEGTLVDSTSGAYKPPEVIQKYGLGLGSSLFDPNFGKNDFYNIGDYKPSTGDYDTAETIQDQAASTEPVCGTNPMNGNQQVYNEALGRCVDRKTGDDEATSSGDTTTTTTSRSWGEDKEGNIVDFADAEALEKYIDSLNTPVDLPGTDTLRDSAALAGKFIDPIAGLAIGAVSLYGKVDATTDIAGLRAGRITAAIYGHDQLVKDIEEKIATYTGGTGFTRGGKFGDKDKKNDAVGGLFGTGFGNASKAHGSTNKEIKAFMEMVDNPTTDPKKLEKVRKELEEKSRAHRKTQRELAKISSDKEKFARLAAERTAAQVAQQQAAARRNPNVIPGSGDEGGSDKLPSETKSGYVSGNVKGLSNPQREEIDRSSSKIDKEDADSFEDLNTGGLVQKRKKKR